MVPLSTSGAASSMRRLPRPNSSLSKSWPISGSLRRLRYVHAPTKGLSLTASLLCALHADVLPVGRGRVERLLAHERVADDEAQLGPLGHHLEVARVGLRHPARPVQ